MAYFTESNGKHYMTQTMSPALELRQVPKKKKKGLFVMGVYLLAGKWS